MGWRDVPTDDSLVGPSARAAEPWFEQVFIGAGSGTAGADANLRFERKLYVIRKRVEKAIETLKINALAKRTFYIVSLSSRRLIYKGMLTAQQLRPMFPDLSDPRLDSALALVHQRFSTNTFPSWPLAHPYRLIAHNGEINTLRGNINWMRARGPAEKPGARRRPRQGPAGDQGRGQRHRHLRQRPRAADDGGPVLAARRADDDPRAVERQRPDGRRSEGVLRVPLVADGAVGRTCVDRVHRRHRDRRRARSQRAAAVALLRHQGRPGGDGLGSGRARHSG